MESKRDVLLPRRKAPNNDPVSLIGPSPAQQVLSPLSTLHPLSDTI